MPSSSLFLRSSATLVSALLLLSSASADTSNTYYALDTEYSGKNFFDGFNFFDDADPTHGFVTYVNETTAQADGLITFNGGSTQMRVDHKNTYNGSATYYNINGVGRPSVRIESIKSWTHGLFVADIKHMPTTDDGSGCGVWPAFWTLGSGTWPYNGEIDIIEGVNNQAEDLTSTHVAGTCVVSQSPLEMTGTTNGNNCQYDVTTGANSQGCGAFDTSSASYGAGFNSNKGGVYAMEWTSDAIKIWFFSRSSIPSDITARTPDPSGWGLPFSIFDGPGCDIDDNFADNRIVFDTTFCGDFGDATWSNSNGCAASTGDSKCSIWVGDNPAQFKDAYWDVNYVQIYQSQPVTTTTSSSTTTTLVTTTRPPYTQSSSTTTTTTTTTTTSSPVVPTTTSYVPPHTIPSSTGGRPTSRSLSIGPFFNTSTTASPSTSPSPSPSPSTWYDWTATTTTDPSTSTWEDWSDPATSSSSTPSSQWQDWTASTTKPTDPATTWGDWSDGGSVVTITKTWTEPCSTGYTTKTTIITTTHCGCTETPAPTACMTTKTFTPSAGWPFSTPVVVSVPCAAPAGATSTVPTPGGTWSQPASLAPTVTAGSWGGKPVSPVAAASTGTGNGAWVSPSVTIGTTLTVAPVQPSSAWVAAASTSPAAPVAPISAPSNGTWGAAATGTNSWVAPYKGAAGRTTLNALAMLAAGAVALGALVM